ncbi:ribosome maturation factor RimP [Cryptosporangium aurantiacum]|uniref:Ribosome maturation factor RimP n=1 Tax=Cryptosporangium aurantiacum TaxID=134849 RepID=A0A1M7INZ5_9ACTN|nr:ribosome maturation factor RimP [Cryptosporangium aurantiacum]SHM42450.1 ribosome maturation factor RimP [Cryptosporangium aurantiacum]
MPAPQAMRSRIVALVEPVVNAAGYDLEEVAVNQAGRRTVVRVVVDTDGGITLDDIAAVSRDVSSALDEDGSSFGSGPYTLEVTSPGVDRPLTEPRHWRRNVGRLVTVRIGDKSLTARITEVDDQGVHLTDDRGVRTATFAELGPGKVQVEFARPKAGTDEAAEGGDR